MDQLDKSIAQQLREVTHTADKSRYPVMTGVVKSVDEGEMTAIVKLTNDDESAPTEGVTLNVLLSNTAGMYAIPANDADCLVMEVDGDGKWEIIRASKYSRVYMKGASKFIDIKDSVVLLNGDGNGGIPKVQKTADKIKALEETVNDILQALKSTTIPLAPSGTYPFAPLYAAINAIAPLTSKSDLENTNVKHG